MDCICYNANILLKGEVIMREYRVLASIYDDLLTSAVVKNLQSGEAGYSTNIHTIKCDSLEEIQDAFLDICGNECIGMNTRMFWYVDDGTGWKLTDL